MTQDANSRVPTSAQTGIHEHLATLLDRHAAAPFRKPYADYNRAAFSASRERWQQIAPTAPLILDSCCGVGESSIALAKAFPDHYVIGVDQSEDRLSRKKPYPDALMPTNLVFVRADLVDYWRLMAEAGIRLARHYILYPNPWPKIGHLARRWHAHPVFPFVPRLGGRLECRSNWNIYVEEFSAALGLLAGRQVAVEAFEAPSPLTPFERKYRDSGQTLYRCVVELDQLEANPS